MYESELQEITSLEKRVVEDMDNLRINDNKHKLNDLKIRQSDPALYNDFDKLKAVNIEIKKLENIVLPWGELHAKLEDLKVLVELSEESGDKAHKEEVVATLAELVKKTEALELLRFFQGEEDANNTYLTIHSGAGGTEACDWALMLYRMYSRYVEKKGFTFSIMDYQEGDEAGAKSVTLFVEGPYAHGYLKCETGVHRLVRISPFDSNKRRHTSFCSVYATPEVEEDFQVVINMSELRIDTYRSSGAGGQHVNKTDSAVRITHLPTNIVVACQAERSQIQNREKAMRLLKAKLHEKMKADHEAEINAKAAEKKKIEWGSQIRSYVLHPYNLVKDHRTDFETSNTQAVLDGEIDGFIQAFLRQGETLAKEEAAK